MAVVRWVFEDPSTLDTYEFAVNPNDGGTPDYSKNIQYKSTSAPDGNVLVFQGRNNPSNYEFSGVLFTEEEYNAFYEWFSKDYQITVTDDLGRTFSIMIESFTANRRRARSHPWKHDYTVKATLVDW